VGKRALGWWFFAEDVGARLTTPRVDVRGSDRLVDRLVLESWLGRSGARVALTIRSSWLDSRSRARFCAIERVWRSADTVVTLRATGWIMIVSAATTLVLQPFGSLGDDGTTRLLPIGVAAAGLTLSWLAGRVSNRTAGGGS
jgi:hypothetical protein